MLQSCPFTAATQACEEHRQRARGAAHDMRKVAGSVDDLFGTVIADALAVANKEDAMADSLEWAREFFIDLAMFPQEIQQFVNELKSGKSSIAARQAVLRSGARPAPRHAGFGEVAHLQTTKASA